MNSSTPPHESAALTHRGVVCFTAMAYLGVGLAFAYLDRRHGVFANEGLLWVVWSVLGFGGGLLHLGRAGRVAAWHWRLMGGLAFALALFPGLALFNLLRWIGFTLLLVIGARGGVMQTRRDLYMTLVSVFVVSLMVATHHTANWTIWLYLAPAWVCAGLALAWDHAGDAAVPGWAKGGLALGFVATTFLLASLLFLFAPRPPSLGFGFVPPGTDTPNLNSQSHGPQGGESGQAHNTDGTGQGGQTDAGASGGGDGWTDNWQRMLDRMRLDLQDPHMPAWQRQGLERVVGWGDWLVAALTGRLVLGSETVDAALADDSTAVAVPTGQGLPWWLVALLALVVGLLCWWLRRHWHRRHGVFATALLHLAPLVATWRPWWSMRLSVWALGLALRQQGVVVGPDTSLREQLALARLPDLPGRWMGYAVDLHNEVRFGTAPATPQRAAYMQQAVAGAHQLLTQQGTNALAN